MQWCGFKAGGNGRSPGFTLGVCYGSAGLKPSVFAIACLIVTSVPISLRLSVSVNFCGQNIGIHAGTGRCAKMGCARCHCTLISLRYCGIHSHAPFVGFAATVLRCSWVTACTYYPFDRGFFELCAFYLRQKPIRLKFVQQLWLRVHGSSSEGDDCGDCDC